MTKDDEMDADAIVEKAFEYFDRLVARGATLDEVLLEGLEREKSVWTVSIGFNGKRHEVSEPATKPAMVALGGFGNKTTKTVREVRHFHLSKDGELKRIG